MRGPRKLDVRVLGNHDYAWSEDEVLRVSHDDHANVLESNVRYDGASAVGFGAKDFVALQVGCVRVGFAGLGSQPWNEQDTIIDGPFDPSFTCTFDFTSGARELVLVSGDAGDASHPKRRRSACGLGHLC